MLHDSCMLVRAQVSAPTHTTSATSTSELVALVLAFPIREPQRWSARKWAERKNEPTHYSRQQIPVLKKPSQT